MNIAHKEISSISYSYSGTHFIPSTTDKNRWGLATSRDVWLPWQILTLWACAPERAKHCVWVPTHLFREMSLVLSLIHCFFWELIHSFSGYRWENIAISGYLILQGVTVNMHGRLILFLISNTYFPFNFA